VGSGQNVNYCAEGLRNFGYKVFQARTPDKCAGLFASEKPELVICEDPCLLADGSPLFQSLRATHESVGVKYLSLTTLAAARAGSDFERTERVAYLIKPVYLEQVIMQVRWLIGPPEVSAPGAASHS
jgi:DNA-binding response OmpR family regulator